MYAYEISVALYIFGRLHHLRRTMSGALLRIHFQLTVMLVLQVLKPFNADFQSIYPLVCMFIPVFVLLVAHLTGNISELFNNSVSRSSSRSGKNTSRY